MTEKQSIYKSPEIKAKLLTIYDLRLKEWPVPFESIFVETSYGRVHVIASGPKEVDSVLLIHAANISASSWVYNVGALNKYYRTYAIDHIGDVGKSVLKDITIFPQDGKDLSDLYTEISDELGVNSAHVVGASNGGYIATNYALNAPERVKKLVLLGPMGLTPATESTVRKLDELASSASIKSSKEQMLNWVIGDNPQVQKMCGEWLSLVLDGVQMQINIPKTFSPSQLEKLQMPVMLLLGKEDHLVGNPENVKTLAQNVPTIEIEVLDTGHLISVEQPDYVNNRICAFLNQP